MLLFLLACASGPKEVPPKESEAPAGPSNVLLLVMDGVRTREFTTATELSENTGTTGQAWAPNTWDSLGKNGTVVRAIYNVGMPITAPSHAALFTGRLESYRNLPAESYDSSLYRPDLPTLFQEAQAQLGIEEDQAHFMADGPLLADVAGTNYPYMAQPDVHFELIYNEKGDIDDPTLLAAIEAYISEHHPRLLAVNLHQADADGHRSPSEDAYEQDVQVIDKGIANIYEFLQKKEPEYFANTTVVLTTDHGRHIDIPEAWRTHGDSCRGCREMPLFVAGPGVPKQELTDMLITQQDVTMYVAHTLGIQLPYGKGLAIGQVGADFPVRSGDVSVKMAGDHRVSERLLDDPFHRNAVYFDDELLSDPDATFAEAPNLLETTNRIYACWREMHLDPSVIPDDGLFPWIGRCVTRLKTESVWSPFDFPSDDVGPIWTVEMAAHDDNLVAAWIQKDYLDVEIDSAVSEYDPATNQWTTVSQVLTTLPTDLVMGSSGKAYWLAAGGNGETKPSRNNRQILVLNGDHQWVLDASPVLGTDYYRAERPAIRASGQEVQVAALGFNEGQTHILLWNSPDGARNWDTVVDVPSPVMPFAHLAPVWDGKILVWAGLDEGGKVEFCKRIEDGTVSCIATDSPRIDSFAVQSGKILASLDSGVGAWTLQRFPI